MKDLWVVHLFRLHLSCVSLKSRYHLHTAPFVQVSSVRGPLQRWGPGFRRPRARARRNQSAAREPCGGGCGGRGRGRGRLMGCERAPASRKKGGHPVGCFMEVVRFASSREQTIVDGWRIGIGRQDVTQSARCRKSN